MKQLTKTMALGLLFSMAASHVEISVAAPAKQEQKQKTFWQRHKAKIIGGLVAAGVLITGAALAYHTNKTMSAIADAGIRPQDRVFPKAVAIVGLLGPMGQERCLASIKKAKGEEKAIAKVFASPIGAALAYYYGTKPITLRTKVGAIIGINVVKQVGEEVGEVLNKAVEIVYDLFN